MENLDPKNSVQEEQFSKDTENNENASQENKKVDNEEIVKLSTKEELESKDESTENNEVKEESSSSQENNQSGSELKVKKTESKDQDDESDGEKVKNSTFTEESVEKIKYSLLSKKDLVKVLDELISDTSKGDISRDVDEIKFAFYKKHKEEISKLKQRFIAEGGLESDFAPGFDENESEFKDLLAKYREQRVERLKVQEEEKQQNLEKKYEIIREIEDLIHKDESINQTFQEFRELQKRWYEIGIVPQKDLKSMWQNYHYHVEKFYDFIKINKELRDLDLRKNLEIKIELCEKAEALLLDTNLIQAFKTLQKYHEQWREIGPVPKEQRSEIWERFKEATAKINRKHQLYYQDLKEQQKKNLEQKMVLCEKAEELNAVEIEEHIEWVEKTNQILELQKVWKTIGYAPKKENNKIYARFRAACDTFFERKRNFYAQNLEDQSDNLQKKIELCKKAEELKDSTDWKQTSNELIKLQRQWKFVGPVPRKQSDEVWKRFRSACDYFFNKRSAFFANIDTTYEENLKLKQELVEKIKGFKPKDNQKDNITVLNNFQKEWAEIGFVPIDKKDEITQKYREAIDTAFDSLKMDDHKKNMLKFRTRIESILQKPRYDVKLRFEREKLMNKLQQLKSDIGVWENNIGFFANTKKADSMISDFEHKIESAHKKIKLLEEKISFIDEVAPEI